MSDSSLTLCQADLYKKQHLEFQRAEAAIRSIMSQPEHAQRLLDEHDPASVARSAAMGEWPGFNFIKGKVGCLNGYKHLLDIPHENRTDNC